MPRRPAASAPRRRAGRRLRTRRTLRRRRRHNAAVNKSTLSDSASPPLLSSTLCSNSRPASLHPSFTPPVCATCPHCSDLTCTKQTDCVSRRREEEGQGRHKERSPSFLPHTQYIDRILKSFLVFSCLHMSYLSQRRNDLTQLTLSLSPTPGPPSPSLPRLLGVLGIAARGARERVRENTPGSALAANGPLPATGSSSRGCLSLRVGAT